MYNGITLDKPEKDKKCIIIQCKRGGMLAPVHFGILLLAFAFHSCALYNPTTDPTVSATPTVTTCNLPNDQSGTLNGRWATIPIPIAVQQGAFSSTELTAITNAADTWNKFHGAVIQSASLDYGGSSGTPRTSASNDPGVTLCSNTVIQNGRFTSQVVIYKTAKWPSTFPSTAMALTTTCFVPLQTGQTIAYFYMAVMNLNYQSFFVQGTKIPDLQTIVSHELGHLEGLGHSCNDTAKTGYPLCSDSNLPTDYLAALMYPSFTFDSAGNGQKKQSLNANDQGRANCLGYVKPAQ